VLPAYVGVHVDTTAALVSNWLGRVIAVVWSVSVTNHARPALTDDGKSHNQLITNLQNSAERRLYRVHAVQSVIVNIV